MFSQPFPWQFHQKSAIVTKVVVVLVLRPIFWAFSYTDNKMCQTYCHKVLLGQQFLWKSIFTITCFQYYRKSAAMPLCLYSCKNRLLCGKWVMLQRVLPCFDTCIVQIKLLTMSYEVILFVVLFKRCATGFKLIFTLIPITEWLSA